MSYTTQRDAMGRTPQVIVTVAVTSCDNLYASAVAPSTCTAADAGVGNRCWYSRPTCQDSPNFRINTSGLKEFRFCLRDAPLPLSDGTEIWPMLKSVEWDPQKIDPEKAVTFIESVKLEFYDDAATWVWNQDKVSAGGLANTGTPSGSFWRRFMAIYRNYSNPRNSVTVKVGFVEAGATEADFQQRGKYLINNLEIDENGVVTMELISSLRLLLTKAPAKISEGNLLNGAIDASVASVTVDDATELTAPGSGYTVTIQIESEFLNVTAIAGNVLTVQRGRWGSTAASHADNLAWKEVLMFGTERDPTPSQQPIGKNPIDCIVELLRRGGIAAADIDTATLNDERDTWLSSTVDAATGSESSNLFRRAGPTIDSGNGGISIQQDIEKLIRGIRDAIMLSLGVGEDQKITGHIFAPARPSVTLTDLTETDNIVKGSLSVNDNEESRVTRVVVCRDLRADKEGTSIEDYQTFTVVVGADEENAAFYGTEPRTRTVFCPWIKAGDTVTANRLAKRLFRRFSNPARKVAFDLEVKDDALKVMDFCTLTTAKIQKPDGSSESQRIMEVVQKKRMGLGRISYESLDTALFGRYVFIGPAGLPDYNAATPAQRRYGYIGSAGQNLVGDPAEAGYRIWG